MSGELAQWGILGAIVLGLVGLVMRAFGKAKQAGRDAREVELRKGWDDHAEKIDRAVQDARSGGAAAARDRLRRAADGGDRAGDGGPVPRPGDRPSNSR